MSKPDRFETNLHVKLGRKPTTPLLDAIRKALNNNERVSTSLKPVKDGIEVKISAKDITVIRSVLNTIFMSIKMLNEIDDATEGTKRKRE